MIFRENAKYPLPQAVFSLSGRRFPAAGESGTRLCGRRLSDAAGAGRRRRSVSGACLRSRGRGGMAEPVADVCETGTGCRTIGVFVCGISFAAFRHRAAMPAVRRRPCGGLRPLRLAVGVSVHHRPTALRAVQYPGHPGLAPHRGQGHGAGRPAYGADGMGSGMIEGHAVSSARVHDRFDAEGIRSTVREAGFALRLHDRLYRMRE